MIHQLVTTMRAQPSDFQSDTSSQRSRVFPLQVTKTGTIAHIFQAVLNKPEIRINKAKPYPALHLTGSRAKPANDNQ